MRKLLVVCGLTLFLMIPIQASAGNMCKLAEDFGWQSPALNTHCVIEWLWELGMI